MFALDDDARVGNCAEGGDAMPVGLPNLNMDKSLGARPSHHHGAVDGSTAPGSLCAPSLDNPLTTMPSSSSIEGSRQMAQITINEGLAWLKTLKKRHEELLALRNDNAHRERRFYGASADKEIIKEPVYDVKVLDRLVTRVARDSSARTGAQDDERKNDNRSLRAGRCRVGRAVLTRERIVGKPEGRAVSWIWLSAHSKH